MSSVRFIAALAFLIYCTGDAFAGNETDTKVECFDGSYVVGLKGRAGAWLDTVNIVCARWNSGRGRLEAPGPAAGGLIGRSEGGDPIETLCSPGFAVAAFWITYTHEDNADVVHHIDLTCKAVAIDGENEKVYFGSRSDSEIADSPPRKTCEPGSLVTGIQGRGHFVEALDLICGKAPTAIVVSGRGGAPYSRDTGLRVSANRTLHDDCSHSRATHRGSSLPVPACEARGRETRR